MRSQPRAVTPRIAAPRRGQSACYGLMAPLVQPRQSQYTAHHTRHSSPNLLTMFSRDKRLALCMRFGHGAARVDHTAVLLRGCPRAAVLDSAAAPTLPPDIAASHAQAPHFHPKLTMFWAKTGTTDSRHRILFEWCWVPNLVYKTFSQLFHMVRNFVL